MFIAGFAQMYNESSKGNLKRFLESVTKIVDHVFIYDDGSTDDSVDVAAAYDKVSVFIGGNNAFDKEIEHKQFLLKHVLDCNPTHILWLDIDEVFEKRAEDGAIKELAEQMTCDAYTFRQINLWRCEKYFRLDNQYGDGLFTRLWRNNGKLHYNVKGGLHQRQYPDGINSVKDSDLLVLHYGFSNDHNIIDKYYTYKSHGQDGWALQRLIDENGLVLAKTRPEWLGREPEGEMPSTRLDCSEIFTSFVK